MGDSRHTAVRGEEKIKRQRQEQPPLIKNALSHAARSYIHSLSPMPGNVFTPHILTAAHTFCLYCTAKGYTHFYVITHMSWCTQCLISLEKRVHAHSVHKCAVALGLNWKHLLSLMRNMYRSFNVSCSTNKEKDTHAHTCPWTCYLVSWSSWHKFCFTHKMSLYPHSLFCVLMFCTVCPIELQ